MFPTQFSWCPVAAPTRRDVLIGVGGLSIAAALPAGAADALAAARRGGHVLLMRHAIAPGTGDPDDLDLSDRSTQRNLSEEGRVQARRTGRALRENGVPVDRVLSSEWWRCQETAQLLDLDEVELFPEALNSFFGRRRLADERIAALRDFIAGWDGAGNAMCVTHQVNITGAVEIYPRSGEIVVVRPAGLSVVGTIGPY